MNYEITQNEPHSMATVGAPSYEFFQTAVDAATAWVEEPLFIEGVQFERRRSCHVREITPGKLVGSPVAYVERRHGKTTVNMCVKLDLEAVPAI